MPTVEEYKKQIEALFHQGHEMIQAFSGVGPDSEPAEKKPEHMIRDYDRWYTQAYKVVEFLLPDRLPEFRNLYLADTKRKEMTVLNYTIQDWLLSRRPKQYMDGRKDFDEEVIVISNMFVQIQILKSCLFALYSTLMNFKKLTLANLFESELDSARELHNNGFLRPAGVIARVVLEKHLQDVCEAHNVKVPKKKNKPPGLADFYNALKKAEVIDLNQSQKLQYLGGITNYCCHRKEREPKPEEVLELLDGTKQAIKTIF